MANIIKRVWRQNKFVQINDLKGMLFQAEQAGHTFEISGIDEDGNTIVLTGTPSGVLLRPDNTDVALTCSVSGGVVSATLPAECYDVPGRFGLTIFITNDNSKVAIYAAIGTISRTSSGTASPGTTQSVVDLINAINAAINSIPASYSDLLADIAPTYSDSALYAVGQYAWYDGDLKRCIVPITTSESYTAAHWTSAVLGQDVSDLKSAFLDELGNLFPMLIVKNQYINNTTGAFENYNGWDRTELIPVANYESITVKSTVQSTYNVFYKADKSFLIKFAVTTTDNVIPIPENAAYVALSNTAAGMANLTVGVSLKIDNEIDELRTDVQDIKNDINTINGIITKSETLHNASYETSYPNGLNNDYVWIMQKPIPQGCAASLDIMSNNISYAGALTVVFLRKNGNGTFTKIQTTDLTTVAGNDFNPVNIPNGISNNSNIYIGFYSTAHGMGYTSSGDTESVTRFDYADIDDEQIVASDEFSMNFSYRLIVYKHNKNVVYVSADGLCDYTSVLDAMENEPEGTTIIVEPGIYEQDMTECLKKRVILIGTDRNQCIIRDTDGRYGHHALYVSCGYFENLTIEEPYISGTSHEVGVSDLGAYAVHIDTDNDYGVGKQIEFYHCNIRSDFFPAVGCGLRKDMTLILDDCRLENGQIANRGDYSDEGTLGALYFHDSNGEQGNQYIIVKDCVLKSKLKYAMCPYQVWRNPQNNRVYCDFINNVLYSDVGKYADTVWFRGDPFNTSTGIFSIGIGYGNSIALLNN